MTPKQKEKRKKIEDLVITTMRKIDKTGKNSDKYRDIFKNMTQAEFKSWINDFLKDDDKQFYMEIVPYKNEPDLNDIKDAADYLEVPLDEYIYYQHDDNKGNPLRSAHKVPIGLIA